MKNYILLISIFLLTGYCFSQVPINEELQRKIQFHKDKIDSLKQIIDLRLKQSKNSLTEELKHKGGISIVAKVVYDLGPIKLYDEEGGKLIKNIPVNSIINIFYQSGDYYVVNYNGVIGAVIASYLDISESTKRQIPFINEENELNTSSSISASNKKQNTVHQNKSKRKKSLNSSGSIHVRGHYRTTKTGKRVWVRPHTRSRN